jgi:ABC-type transport system substrate-binding protein
VPTPVDEGASALPLAGAIHRLNSVTVRTRTLQGHHSVGLVTTSTSYPRVSRALVAIGTAALIALTASGCKNKDDSKTATRGGTLVFARAADIRSLDPTAVVDNPSIWALEQIYDTLYTPTADGKGVRPWLATGYTLSDDKRVWTFRLRPGVRFSDGRPLRAEGLERREHP